jgi:hypothetical protein
LINFDCSIILNRHARESGHLCFAPKKTEIPACAGMTDVREVEFKSDHQRLPERKLVSRQRAKILLRKIRTFLE